MTGKQYVQQAREELINQPIKMQEQEETLKSRPDPVRLQRTKLMIEKQISSRRERHISTMEQFEKNQEDF